MELPSITIGQVKLEQAREGLRITYVGKNGSPVTVDISVRQVERWAASVVKKEMFP